MGDKITKDNVDFVRSITTHKYGELLCDDCGKPVKNNESVGQFGTYHKDCLYGK